LKEYSMSIRLSLVLFLSGGLLASAASQATAQQTARSAPVVNSAQNVLAQASQEGKFTFLLFYKQNDVATSAMNTTLQQSLTQEADRALSTFVLLSNPANQAVVAKFDVSRAPMPMTLVVAPNGAITGMFANKLTAENVQEALVTPTMMTAMKALQDGKLVFVTVHGSGRPVTPPAVRELQNDPHFNTRLVTLTMRASDPNETMFLGQMQMDPNATTTNTALIAPPGVLVGQFKASTPMMEIAAALAGAGKCCDDPNCKHHKATPQTATQGTKGTRK
jgi:hypothetical protein